MNVRSFFTLPDVSAIPFGRPYPLQGIAFDGGDGIRQVEVSLDGGSTWASTELGDDLGRFSFRRWRLAWTPAGRGSHNLQVRATNKAGQTQPTDAGWNRGGFMRNAIEKLPVTVVYTARGQDTTPRVALAVKQRVGNCSVENLREPAAQARDASLPRPKVNPECTEASGPTARGCSRAFSRQLHYQ